MLSVSHHFLKNGCLYIQPEMCETSNHVTSLFISHIHIAVLLKIDGTLGGI